MKKSNIIGSIIFTFLVIILMSQCSDNSDLPYKYQDVKLSLPTEPFNYRTPSIPENMSFFLKNELESTIDNDVATVGRVLFYDKFLSKNNTVSCGSCHKQASGFADNVSFSSGVSGSKTDRNTSSLGNTIASRMFFWDGRESNLSNLALQPVRNHKEMGLDNMAEIIKRINTADYYKPLFKKAFGSEEVTAERISEGLKQFVNSIIVVNAPASEILDGGWGDLPRTPENFTNDEKLGSELFFGKAMCFACHTTNLQGSRFDDIGLESDYTNKDRGKGEWNVGSDGFFKIPSLLNVEFTAPYMHDGRFKTLEEVIDHYSEGIKPSENLSWIFRGELGQPRPLGLNASEKKQLVAFLKKFSDQTVIKEEKYSDPFE